MMVVGADGRLLRRHHRRPAGQRHRPRPDAGVCGRACGAREADLGPGDALRRRRTARAWRRSTPWSPIRRSFQRFSYTAPGGAAGSGYAVTCSRLDATAIRRRNDPTRHATITSGPYAGFKGIITEYPITVTARSTGGAEVRLRRELQTVAVPVFQFGVFSETDLTFYAGDDFDFGGRVHTNGNLFLSELSGKTLTVHRSRHRGRPGRPRRSSRTALSTTSRFAGPVLRAAQRTAGDDRTSRRYRGQRHRHARGRADPERPAGSTVSTGTYTRATSATD